MSFVIFGDAFTFPEGSAATNRVYTYAKGFVEHGISVHIVCFRNDYLDKYNGEINGIKYYHPFGQTKRSKYFIVRRWQKFIKYFKTIKLLKEINKSDKVIAINSWTLLLFSELFAFFLAKYTRSNLISEHSEHPLRNYQSSCLRKIQGETKSYLGAKLCDGIFCISQYLIDFYKSKGVNSKRLLLVPSTVDPKRFSQTSKKPLPFPYIGYFGSLTFDRDNIDVLIKAFSLITNKHPEVHLVMGGFCSDDEKKKIENLITELKLSFKVDILKYLTREEIIKYIIHADILIMVRAPDLKSQASFPSKLTEYLATSKPVVTVKVGEISDYLINGVNSFIVEPGNGDALAEKLDYILTDYDTALQIGRKGQELTQTIFNYNFQARRMIDFINSL